MHAILWERGAQNQPMKSTGGQKDDVGPMLDAKQYHTLEQIIPSKHLLDGFYLSKRTCIKRYNMSNNEITKAQELDFLAHTSDENTNLYMFL